MKITEKESRVFKMPFAKVYPLYLAKVNRKGVDKNEVDRVIYWLTGYNKVTLKAVLDQGFTMEEFFAKAPALNPLRNQIKGKICGVQVETIENPLMQNIRYLDKLIDELAKGKAFDKFIPK